MLLRLEFPGLIPVSVNQLYVNIPGQSRRFISAKGKEFKKAIETEVTALISSIPNAANILSEFEGKKLAVLIQIYSPTWYLKDGVTLRKIDVSNFSKACVDSIFSSFVNAGFNLDDHQIFSETAEKKDSETNSIVVVLSTF